MDFGPWKKTFTQPFKVEVNQLGFVDSSVIFLTDLNWVVVSNVFYFYPYLGKISNLTNIFQMGWNHQLVKKTWDSSPCSPPFGESEYVCSKKSSTERFLNGPRKNLRNYLIARSQLTERGPLVRSHSIFDPKRSMYGTFSYIYHKNQPFM